MSLAPLFLDVDGSLLSVPKWSLRQPLQGAWSADLRGVALGDVELAQGDSVILTEGTERWLCSVASIVREGSTSAASIVVESGAAKSRELTQARHWSGSSTVGDILATLCADVGESAESGGPSVGSWRARGRTLAEEALALAQWTGTRVYAGQDGIWRAEPLAWESVDPTGYQMGGSGRDVRYERTTLAPLAGRELEGRRIALAVYEPGYVEVYPVPQSRAALGAIVGATVDACDDGRVDVTTDDGVAIVDIALWSAPGVRAIVPSGTRVLVADLGGDPRSTFAMLSPWEAEPSSIRIGEGADEVLLADGVETVIRQNDLLTVAAPISPGVPFVLTLAAPDIASKVKA